MTRRNIFAIQVSKKFSDSACSSRVVKVHFVASGKAKWTGLFISSPLKTKNVTYGFVFATVVCRNGRSTCSYLTSDLDQYGEDLIDIYTA
jgi:hypothetical protein